VKASPEHFENKYFNLDRQNNTISNIFKNYLHKCKISLRVNYTKISQINVFLAKYQYDRTVPSNRKPGR